MAVPAVPVPGDAAILSEVVAIRVSMHPLTPLSSRRPEFTAKAIPDIRTSERKMPPPFWRPLLAYQGLIFPSGPLWCLRIIRKRDQNAVTVPVT